MDPVHRPYWCVVTSWRSDVVHFDQRKVLQWEEEVVLRGRPLEYRLVVVGTVWNERDGDKSENWNLYCVGIVDRRIQ